MKKNSKKIIILILLFISSKNKPCGIINLFKEEYILDQSDLLKLTQNLEEKHNGKEMTIYGWMKFNNDFKQNIPLLNLKIMKDKEENGKLFHNIISITYNESFFLIKFLKETKKTIEKKFFFNLKNNENWFFIGFSFDYSFGNLNFFVSDLIFQKNEKFKLNYRDFFIGKSFELDIGCIPNDELKKETLLKSCMLGFSKNFNYVFEYFEKIENLYLLGNGENKNINFLFDTLNGNKLYSNNDEEKNFITIENKIDQQNISEFKGNEQIFTDWMIEGYTENSDISSPGLFIVFSFREILIDKFLLFTVETENKIKINFFLEKIGNERKLKIDVIELSYAYIFSEIFPEKLTHKISISFINLKNELLILLKSPKKDEFNNKIPFFNVKNKSKLIFFNNSETKNGLINLYQISLFLNSSGVIYNKIKNNLSTHNLRCNKKCDLYSSIAFNKSTCLDCNQNYIFLSQISNCINFCPKASFNKENRCFKCKNENCEKELDQKFFEFSRTNSTDFLVSSANYPNYNIFKNDTFTIKVDNSFLGDKNYEKIKKNKNSVVYRINKIIDDDKVEFVYKDLLIDDGNKNILQNQNHLFEPINNKILKPKKKENKKKIIPKEEKEKEKERKNNNIKIFNPNIINNFTEDQKNNSENTKELKPPKFIDYKQNSSIDNICKILSKIVFYFIIIAFILGLIRLFIYFTYNDNNTFFYQKWIQSFLMAQYIVFTILYSFSFPYNLKNFLLNFFKISVKWQFFFTDLIKDNFSSSSYFKSKFFINNFSNFYNLNIQTHFILNSIFILFFHAGILVILVLFFLIYLCLIKKIKRKEMNGFTHYIKNIVHKSFFKIIISVFLIFMVEILIFAFYSLTINFKIHIKHILFFVSFLLCIIYLFFTIFFLLVILNKSFSKNNSNNFKFIIYGLDYLQNQQFYQFFQYLHYFFFSLFLVILNSKPFLQIILNLIILALFLLYLIFSRPAFKNFFKFDQIFVYFLLLIAIIFLFLLFIDEKYEFMNENSRYIFGFIIVLIFAFILIYNSLVVIILFFLEIINYFKYNRYEKKLEDNENLYYNNNLNLNRITSDRNNNILINDNENLDNEINNNFENFPIQGNNNINQQNDNHPNNKNEHYFNLRNPNFSKKNLNKMAELPEEKKNFIKNNKDEIFLNNLNDLPNKKPELNLKEKLKTQLANLEKKNEKIRKKLKSFKKLNDLKKKSKESDFMFKDSSIIQKEDSWNLKDVDYSLIDVNKDFENFADKVLRSEDKSRDN